MAKTRNKIIITLLIFNMYLIFFLFKGENTVFNFLFLQKKVETLNGKYLSLIKQRYDIANIQTLLQTNSADSDDVLDGLLRSITQSSLPDEKVIILD